MISSFILSYGYMAVLFGTLLEGETILVAAGFAAHQGLLDWHRVVLLAFIGASLGDQLAFLLGRWKGSALIERFAFLRQRAPRILTLLERHHVVLILAMRFMYGVRIAGPVVMGASRVAFYRFALLNMLGAAVWACVITGAGFLFGLAIEHVFSNIRHVAELIILLILAGGAGIALWRQLRR